MSTLRELAIEIGFKANVRKMDQVDQKLEDIKNEATRGTTMIGRLGQSLRNAFAGIGIGTAIAMIGRKMVGTINEFERLRAQLTTIEGSTDKANRQFDKLQAFASETPFQLQRVVAGFTALRGAGLKPTMKDMQTMGDVAAGMNADIVDVSEAFAKAQIGNFELLRDRLKISVEQAGDQVTFAFGDFKKTVKKESGAINQALLELGRAKFAGGMARQAATIGGAFSNLQDNIAKFFAEIGERGLSEELVKLMKLLTNSAGGATSLAIVLGRSLAASVRVLTTLVKFLSDNFKLVAGSIGTLTTVLIAYKIGMVATKFITMEVTGAQIAHALAVTKTGLAYLALGLKILAVAAILGIFYLAINDLYHFLEGNESVLGNHFKDAGYDADEAFATMMTGLVALLGLLAILAATVGLPFVVIIGLIGLLVALIWYLVENVDKIGPAFEELGEALGVILDWMLYKIEQWIGEADNKLTAWATGFGAAIGTAIREALDSAGEWIDDFVDETTMKLAKIANAAAHPLDFAASLMGGGAASPGVDASRRSSEVTNNRSANVNATIPITFQGSATAADNDAMANDMERKVAGVFKRILGGVAGDLEGETD